MEIANVIVTLKLLAKGYSISRFNNAEIRLIHGDNDKKVIYQRYDKEMANMLAKILSYSLSHPKLLVGVEDMYVKRIPEMINSSKKYYSSTITKPKIGEYIGILDLFKRIWKGKNIIMVTNGELLPYTNSIETRFFNNAKSLRYVIVPANNAFRYRHDILCHLLKFTNDNTVILLSIGPTASILAFELATHNYHAIDFGQVVNRYHHFFNVTTLKTSKTPVKVLGHTQPCLKKMTS